MRKFQIIVSTIVLLIFLFFYVSLIYPLRVWPLAYGLGLFGLILGMFNIYWMPLVYFQSRETVVRTHERVLELMAHGWMGFLSFVLFFSVVREILRLVLLISQPDSSRASAPEVSLYILAASGLFFIWGYVKARTGPRVVRADLPTSYPLPKDWRLTIAQISDLHVGSHIRADYVSKVVRQTNELAPDLILLTGDIGDGDVGQHAVDLEPLRQLRAKRGIFYCTGNHEFYWDEPLWIAKLKELGIQVLDNASTRVDLAGFEFEILGINDTRPDFAAAMRDTRDESFKILLAHRPDHAETAATLPIHLQLSGHTHGGQFLPWTWMIGFVHRYVQGLYRIQGLTLYVNPGTGFWGPPLRLGTGSEISFLTVMGVGRI